MDANRSIVNQDEVSKEEEKVINLMLEESSENQEKQPNIIFKSVSKLYSGKEDPAVYNFSLAVKKGTLTCLLGPNGAGKSSLLDITCGITPKTSGDLLFGDTYIHQ